MWVLDADISLATVDYVRIVVTTWVLDADLSVARVHYVTTVSAM